MTDADIDLSDLPEVDANDFARGLVRRGLEPGLRKRQLTLRLDVDVLNWYRATGKGYQSRMNAVLKAYKEAHEDLESGSGAKSRSSGSS